MCIKHKLKVGWQREGESEKGREIETYRSSRERERGQIDRLKGLKIALSFRQPA